MSREAVGETTKAINIDRALIFSALLLLFFLSSVFCGGGQSLSLLFVGPFV